jgi:glycosyltransferase involved in cell wall biosynthesis
VNESVRDELRARYPGREREIVTIYNGFDPEDLASLPRVESPFTRRGALRLVYLGTLYQDVNVPVNLFHALARLRSARTGDQNAPETYALPLEIVLVGMVDPRFVDMVEELDIADLVRFVPYMPHREALATLSMADAAVLLVDPHRHADRHVPGKLYEYLGSRIPVVALAPTGSEAARIVTENRAGVVLPPDDVHRISLGLDELMRSKESGEALPRISGDALAPFDRRNQADMLHSILERILGEER